MPNIAGQEDDQEGFGPKESSSAMPEAMTFGLREHGYAYRPLRKGLSGWDCFALQKLLLGLGYPLPLFGADGFFGDETHQAVTRFQQANGLVRDGIAGVLTQRMGILLLVRRESEKHQLPNDLEQGQVESECSFQAGNYTAPYANGRRDLGPVMLNLDVTEDNCRKAFDVPARLAQLAAFLRSHHDAYYGQVGAKTHERAWELAAGAWNAPAWADTLARGGTISATQREHISAYIARVTAYCSDLNVP